MQQPRGLLDVAHKTWEEHNSPFWSLVDYIQELQERIDQVSTIIHVHMEWRPPKESNRGPTIDQPNPGNYNPVTRWFFGFHCNVFIKLALEFKLNLNLGYSKLFL